MMLALYGYGRWGKNIERTLKEMAVPVVIVKRGDTAPVVDGVIIATPTDSHAEIAIPFIENGVPVFIEKPLAHSVRAAARIREALQEKSIVHVGHIHLHSKKFKEIQKAVTKVKGMTFDGYTDAMRTESSIFSDWLPHPLSMALTLIGSPASVEASVLPNEGMVDYTWKNGVKLLCTLKWDAEKLTRFTVQCDKRYTYMAGQEKPLTYEMQAFVDAIKKGIRDTKQVDLGLEIVRLIAAAEDSARRRGATVKI